MRPSRFEIFIKRAFSLRHKNNSLMGRTSSVFDVFDKPPGSKAVCCDGDYFLSKVISESIAVNRNDPFGLKCKSGFFIVRNGLKMYSLVVAGVIPCKNISQNKKRRKANGYKPNNFISHQAFT